MVTMLEADAQLIAQVRDQDLLDRLQAAKGKPGYATMQRLAAEQQAERDHLRDLSPVALTCPRVFGPGIT